MSLQRRRSPNDRHLNIAPPPLRVLQLAECQVKRERRLAQLRDAGFQRELGARARRRIGTRASELLRAAREWQRTHEWPGEMGDFRREILPALLNVSAPEVARATGLSVGEHTPSIYRLARAIVGEGLARDVVQEVFLSAWRELPKLREPERFPAWLHRVAVNRSRSALLGQRRVFANLTFALVQESLSAGDYRSDVETRAALMPVLLALPFDQRVVVALHYAEGRGRDLR